MFSVLNVIEYQGASIKKGDEYIYVSPDSRLSPYISHYCISFPTPQTMPDNYTILPSANAVLVVVVDKGCVRSFLNGTNTGADVVGAKVNTFGCLLLVKFRPGGFSAFYRFNQSELANVSLILPDVDRGLAEDIEAALMYANTIEVLIGTLNRIFISRLRNNPLDSVDAMLDKLIQYNGCITMRELAADLYYSEKHLRRLFIHRVGTSPKVFSRILRVNHTLTFMQKKHINLAHIATMTGFFDQSHFIHDFQDIFGINPCEYVENMSLFYNAESF